VRVHRALSPGVEAGELRRLGKSHEDTVGDNYRAAWKIEVAVRLREEAAPCAWITAELHMGKVSSVRSYLSQSKSSV
jgi:hypothetical protein